WQPEMERPNKSDKRIDELDAVVADGRSHVLGVEREDAGCLARAEDHTVPVRKAIAAGKIQGCINDVRRRQDEWKGLANRCHIAQQPGAGSAGHGPATSEAGASILPALARESRWGPAQGGGSAREH